MDWSNCLVTIDLTNKSVPIGNPRTILRPPNHRLWLAVQATVVLGTHDETQQPHPLDNVDHLPELQLSLYVVFGFQVVHFIVTMFHPVVCLSVQWPGGMSSLPLLCFGCNESPGEVPIGPAIKLQISLNFWVVRRKQTQDGSGACAGAWRQQETTLSDWEVDLNWLLRIILLHTTFL